MSNHIAICKPVGQTNLKKDESYRPTELPKAQPSAELPKGATFFDKVFRAGGIKYCVTA